MFSYFRKLRAYNDTRSQLSRLSARELDDIGLNRGDIDDIAKEAYYNG